MEVTIISILVASAIAAGISIFFHEADKKNNAIEKVKRYADKRQEDLAAFYKTVEGKVNLLITEFDSRQSQANAAVKLLSQHYDEFSNKIQTLDDNIRAVQEIEKQINKYAQLMDDLNEMTGNVEENLRRIQKESHIVDQMTGKLNKQQEIVDQIDQKIPKVSENFSKHNAEQLKAVGTTLLQQYKDYADKLAREIKQSQTDAEFALEKIKQEFQNAYNEAASRADNLENTAFEHLSQQAQERSDNYIKKLNEQTQNLENKLAAAFEQKSNTITTKFNSDMDTLTQSYTAKVQSAHEKYEQQLSSIIGKNDGILAKIETRFNEDFAKISEKYDSQLAAINDRCDRDYQQIVENFNFIIWVNIVWISRNSIM